MQIIESLAESLAASIRDAVAEALDEDVGSGDLTASLIPVDAMITATIITREAMTLAGQPWANETFRQIDPDVRVAWEARDGDVLTPGDTVCTIVGSARSVLTSERTALNFLQLLSSTSTSTAAYVAAVAGTGCRILDTRKTVPGMRLAQKYAVACGGGTNHRIGLFDAILIKENHIASAGSITLAVAQARQLHAGYLLEVEAESLEELQEALAAQADRVLLDNFSIADLQRAVKLNCAAGQPAAELEASGNITLENVREVAETGVDFVSIGALTKNIRAIDLSLRIRSH